MPDISMCSGDGCLLAEMCYRHTAKPNGDRQSWFAQSPNKEEDDCDYFSPNEHFPIAGG